MIYENIDQLKKGIEGVLKIDGDDVKVLDEEILRSGLIDDLVYSAVFSPDKEIKDAATWLIRRAGVALGVISASIQSLYEAMGRGEAAGFTVPAINLRGICYDSAQAVLRSAVKANIGAVIFEIARSEIGYTDQRPVEYTTAVTAAAIKTGFRGPLFMQGDHFQVNLKKFTEDPAREIETVKDIIREGIEGGFYNIDIDTSTVVDLSKPTIKEQQEKNYSIAADMTAMIRDIEPEGVTVSVGGEIGEIGSKNSTVEELQAFMDGYLEELSKRGEGLKGISKISVQTGATHGGVPLPDGTVAKVKIDFDTLEKLSESARSDYGLSGAVQHGASTLPDEAFGKFLQAGTSEVHLATGFQNIIYDSDDFPAELKEKIYNYIKAELSGEWKEKDTEEQFIYKTRKKGFGHFKKEMWDLPSEIRKAIGEELENKFSFLFNKLNVLNTNDVVSKFVKAVDVPLKVPASLK
ncbi:MAG: class II fructose-bisphosphate aldolase [Thermodesulfobacteriota bacterium]|nr:class II fructose-bisphosphate aldolase [Thermodesulfobacteriota bacterium]